MPFLRIETNVPKSKIPDGLGIEFCELISTMLNMEVSNCCVNIVPDQMMSFGTSDEPCAQVVLRSSGGLGVVENNKICKAIFGKLQSSLGIQPNKACVHIMPVTFEQTGFEGVTLIFHDFIRKLDQ